VTFGLETGKLSNIYSSCK